MPDKNGLKSRMLTWAVDMLIIIASIVLSCVVVFGVVHLFRLFGTGRYILNALAKSGLFFEKALWPALILIGFVVFRRQIIDALNEVPTFIKHYAPYEKISDASGTEETRETSQDEKNEKEEITGGGRNVNRLPRREAGAEFEDYVVACLQAELGVTVTRNVILFNNRMLRFDGVIVRGDKITALEIKYGNRFENIERSMFQFIRFHKSISKQDQEHFNVMFCLPMTMRSQLSRFAALRSCLPFPIEYRFFDMPLQEK